MEKKYLKRIDIVRILSCFAVLMYHLNIIKGGFLAVCTFFVLTGYLSCMSAYHKEKFSIKDYYLSRLKRIYIPLLVVVNITIILFTIIPDNGWLNMKPESFSTIFGYNNFWQIESNYNYFTKQVSSPFLQFWYISILMQFDLIFPFIFIGLKKINGKLKRNISTLVIFVLTIVSTVYFYYASKTQDTMNVYYSTFTRIFSILWGCLVANIHHNRKKFILKKWHSLIYIAYLVIISILFAVTNSSSSAWNLIMIIITIMSCRIIDYSTAENVKKTKFDKVIKLGANYTYEIFLVQCPIIFLFQRANMDYTIKNILGLVIIFLLACILHEMINYKGKGKKMSILFKTILTGVVAVGSCCLITAKDYSREIKELELQMEQNTALINEKNQQYAAKTTTEQEEWNMFLNSFNNEEEEVRKILKELKVVGIGDSVMLGAVPNLYEYYPNGYFDAKVSRSIYGVNSIVQNLKNQNKLGDVVIFNLGANGEGSKKTRDEVIEIIGNENPIFWMTVTNDKDVHVNGSIKSYPSQYSNMHVIDWEKISSGHKDYFYADGIHLTPAGRKAFAKAVDDALYDYYVVEYRQKKEEAIKKHEEELKNKVAFYGNDVLIFLYDYLQKDFPDASFNTNKEYTFEMIKEEIEKKKENNTLEHKLFFAFDTLSKITDKDYEKLVELCNDNEIYILNMNERRLNISNENVKVIDFYKELINNDNYFLKDKVHLSVEGNMALSKLISQEIYK